MLDEFIAFGPLGRAAVSALLDEFIAFGPPGRAAVSARLTRWWYGVALGVILIGGGSRAVSPAELAQSPASYPLCTAASLAAFPWTHRAFGKAIPGIALRNTSLATCRVAGFPQVAAYETTGRRAAVRIERQMFADTTIYAYSVTPGAAVFFALYGQAPHGEFDRSCLGIGQLDIVLPGDRAPIDVTLSSGTCGGRMSVSQIFPVSELAR